MSKIEIVKNMSFSKVSAKMDITIEFSVSFMYFNTGQHDFSTFFRKYHFLTLESLNTVCFWCFEGLGLC